MVGGFIIAAIFAFLIHRVWSRTLCERSGELHPRDWGDHPRIPREMVGNKVHHDGSVTK